MSKGTAGKSASGASMSKYDVEVEGRLKQLEGYVGKYFSNEYIRTKILKQNEQEINDIDKQIEEEGAEPEQSETVPGTTNGAAGPRKEKETATVKQKDSISVKQKADKKDFKDAETKARDSYKSTT